MMLLDTNVVSETMRPDPSANVRVWLDAQASEELFLCVPVLAELHYGIEGLPMGARRRRLERAVQRVQEAFADRILPLDHAAAREYGKIVAQRDRIGRATGTMDGLIAAIAKVHGATIATRDVHGFDDVGLDVVDPFTHGRK
jgi:hypothetical protein